MARLGSYEVEGEVGRGNMGRVLRGRHKDTGIVRAIKVLTGVGVDAELIARFQREAELLARVGGAHVVPVHEAGAERGHLYYVMDLLPGGSLRDIVKRGTLPWREAARLVAKVARAIHRCHEVGIVHRDVKPENILIDDRGEPRLSDFGCARDLISQRLTVTGTLIGTPSYMPPEQLRGETVDHRADIYALGVILYELATGSRPYSGQTWLELCESSEKGSRPSSHDSIGAPPELDDILSHTLAPRPADRYASAADLADDLDDLAEAGPERAAARPRSSLLKHVWIAAACALVVTGGLVAWRIARRPAPPPPQETKLAVTLDAPGPDAVAFYDEALVVSGSVTGFVGELTVNGAHVAVRDGLFATSIAGLPDTASVDVVVVARGVDGTSVTTKRHIKRDWHMPVADWYRTLSPDSRPRIPLPPGLGFGSGQCEYVNEKDGSVLVFVTGATFEMGMKNAEGWENELKQRHLGPFFIGKFEVTNERFARFVAATGHVTKAEADGTSYDSIAVHERHQREATMVEGLTWHVPFLDKKPSAPNEPVVHVSWDDAMAYAKWAGLSLPSEVQWERAASWDPDNGRKLRYAWGDEVPTKDSPLFANLRDASLYTLLGMPAPNSYDDGFPHLSPVGRFDRDRAPCGAYDMTGNALEWCGDDHVDIDLRRLQERSRPDSMLPLQLPDVNDLRVAKGGSWNTNPEWFHLARRFVWPRSYARGNGLGFRIALIPKSEKPEKPGKQ